MSSQCQEVNREQFICYSAGNGFHFQVSLKEYSGAFLTKLMKINIPDAHDFLYLNSTLAIIKHYAGLLCLFHTDNHRSWCSDDMSVDFLCISF